MEGPGQVFYGSAPAAAAAAAEAIDAHGDQLATHTADIATANANIATANASTATNAAAISATNATVAAINSVPVGAIVAFRTASELTSAGAGWARETNLDGRILIGAGTAGGLTFTEATNYGTTWTVTVGSQQNTPAGGAVNSGAGSTAAPAPHTHNVDVLLVPPARAYVYARKN